MLHHTKMTPLERRSVISLSSIMSLRMIGLFMVLPVFSLYAHQLRDATPTLIGLAMGIYGLFQALFQIPLGSLSDRYGRKPIIMMGLIVFTLGSITAGLAHTMTLMLIGRALQGIGAVGSTLMALMADLTRENQRTKAMAMAGITIGFSFSVAMLIGPLLTQWLTVNNLFFFAAAFSMLGILILYVSVPTPITIKWHRDTEPELKSFIKLLASPELARLNIGILILHAIFTASFVVIPISLKQFTGLESHQQWEVYLPTLLIAFVCSLICIGTAERKQQLKFFFLNSIGAIAIAELLFWIMPNNKIFVIISLFLFFTGFSLLEAFLPSLVSRTAPAARKGSALGIYSCSQFFGIFIGGTLGGWLYGKFSFLGVYLFNIMLGLCWLTLAFLMQPPRYLVTQMWNIRLLKQNAWENMIARLQVIPGIVEVALVAEDRMIYLKMERDVLQHPDFIHLKEQLQSEK
ncbi:MAG: MFS transporter [Gammaproteobacteria bacterium]|nr:MFS transporter [Gammaproteobacteria bacterium]MCW5583866.1 MFS transporter [Gammaproteobacteria bacterium]